MNSNLTILTASVEMSIVLFCFFGMVYLVTWGWKINRWPILIFFVHLWVIFNIMMSSSRYGILSDSSFFLSLAPFVLFFPALYFYTQDLVQPKEYTFLNRLPHFLPFVILYSIGVVIGHNDPLATLLQQKNQYWSYIVILAILGTVIFYSFYILKLVNLNQHKYQNEYANSNLFLTLKWMKWMVFILISLPFLGSISNQILKILTLEGELLVVYLSILLAMLVLGLFTFRQPQLYEKEKVEIVKIKDIVSNKLASTDNELNNKKFAMSISDKAAYIFKIEAYLKTKKPFLHSDIRMPQLAQDLDIPRHIFSYIINDHYGMNFFNLINSHRVEYAKNLLRNKEMKFYTLESIGEISGFKSRSTFYKHFKDIVGVSPKEYQQNESKI